MAELTDDAVTESLMLYNWMVTTGRYNKHWALVEINIKGFIKDFYYRHYCPLCEKYMDARDTENRCKTCPWPGVGDARCQDGEGFLVSDIHRIGHGTYGLFYVNRCRETALRVYEVIRGIFK